MKREYTKPSIALVKAETETNILAASGGGLSDSLDEKLDVDGTYKTSQLLSKYRKEIGDLWNGTLDDYDYEDEEDY